ncbi:MAG: transcription antitermination factor NusB [Sphingobacteriales bacterium]|nr:MAG: transcription antitermination factor NusB [Sphingobacteriales bacterium]
MQIIYGCEQKENHVFDSAKRQLLQNIDKTHHLYHYSLYFLREVGSYVKTDKMRREQKFLPTEEDKNLSLQLYYNPLIQKLQTDSAFTNFLKKEKLNPLLDNEVVKKLYQIFSKDSRYLQYAQIAQPTTAQHASIILHLFNFLFKDELFVSHVEEHFSNWEDDNIIVADTIKTLIYQFGKKDNLGSLHIFSQPEDWEEKLEFSQDLLQKALLYDKELKTLIEPQLQHWDIDRLTQVDIILIKMALCEFLYFPTIPTKVTINEYIEVAKMYSTPGSKNFINGVLDKIMKTLKSENRILKTGRGLIDFD